MPEGAIGTAGVGLQVLRGVRFESEMEGRWGRGVGRGGHGLAEAAGGSLWGKREQPDRHPVKVLRVLSGGERVVFLINGW